MSDVRNQLDAIRTYVHDLFQNDATGHDFYHMERVAQLAKTISMEEKADTFICEAAAWLHDVGDKKLFTNPGQAMDHLDEFLIKINIERPTIEQIYDTTKDVSFSKGSIPTTIEGQIVQDADRLDAIGAIGIARTFAYGGATNQLIYQNGEPENTSVQHFYDKLLTIKDLMNTNYAKGLAKPRHAFLESYLKQFFREWES
ncbi:metal-dependent phosphohydrolase [Virgibacillus phasianinus]|uniref:Metal-dependent phosphohydrolase n=1 Tax=Virgibacillus phasianinus TaxID=2017483 RepID=A0A220U5K8_9BACI|nr:HD domain-containing protein [Virgibacillus phasianinus]ASK63380.1 metal-dependent phosphohydrolase [Virgibacillus phasianinus]